MKYSAPFDVSRRRFLKYGVFGTALLAGGGYAATRMTDAGIVPRIPVLNHLDAGGQSVFGAVSDVVLDGMLPEGGTERRAAIDDVLVGIDGLLNDLPESSRKEVKDLLGLLAMAPTRFILGGRWGNWDAASRDQVRSYLDGLASSRAALKRTAFVVLRDMPTSAFYGSRRSWELIGYDGPMFDNDA